MLSSIAWIAWNLLIEVKEDNNSNKFTEIAFVEVCQ